MIGISRRSLLAGGAGLLVSSGLRAGIPEARPIAATRAGRLAGVVDNGTLAFKGVPYGESTAGAARFLPPVPKAPWNDVRDATAFGPRSPQRGGADLPGNSEDCLVLNVWTPALDAELPVMVWLHGGGWETGGSSDPVSNGAYLARTHGVVVVSVNHRLNVFGYLNLADVAGERYAKSGQAGILDIVLALRWVRENIAGFGGDPSRVMIFGQSGGGRKVSTLLAMPDAAGLFTRAAVHSGPGLSLDPVDISLDRTERVLRKLGIARKDFARLQSVPTATLLATGIEVRNETGQFRPFVDGSVIPAKPFLDGAPLVSADVPVIVSTARDELAAFLGMDPAFDRLGEAELLKQSLRFFPEGEAPGTIAAWRALFPDFPNDKLFVRMITDRSYFLDSSILAERKAALGRAPAYACTLDFPTDVGLLKGVTPHGLDLPFVFGNLDAWPQLHEITPEAVALRSTMTGAWTAFARDGVPHHPSMPKWLPYEPSLRATMLFGKTVRLESDPFAAERTAMARFGSEQLLPAEPRPPGMWAR